MSLGAIGTFNTVVLLTYLGAVMLFGMWVGRRVEGVADFWVGSRSLPWWSVLLSIVATETSVVSFLSVPGLAYAPQGDLTFLQLPLGYILGRILVVVFLLPLYFRGENFTTYQVLGRRFGGAVSRATSALFIVTRTLADGLRLYLAALVLSVVADLPQTISVLVVGVATVAYTFTGGIRAVVWTDCVQFVVYVAGACFALFVLLGKLPESAGELFTRAVADGKLRVFDFALDFTRPYVFLAGIVGGAFLSFATHGVDQMMVQRLLCARGQRAAAVALLGSGVLVLLQFGLFLCIGVALYYFYLQHPPATPFEGTDKVFASFIVTHLKTPVGLIGVVLGGVFSAAMSTLSSSLNSSAAAAVHDLYLPQVKRDIEPRRLLRLTRALTVVFGISQMAVAMSGPWGSDVISGVLAIASVTTGITLGLFLLGIFDRKAGERAALIALVCGMVGMTAVTVDFQVGPLRFGTDLAWPWYSVVGSLGTLLVGFVAARLVGEQGE